MREILIVGAGPVGLTLAAELARYGVPVRIIDRAAHPSRTSKALVIWSRTLELMDRMGCTPAFLAAGLRARGVTIRDGATVIGHNDFDHVASPYPFPLMIPQSETERLLAAHLANFGVAVEREVELVGFEAGAKEVAVRLRNANGREEVTTTPWLLGCDAAHSAVRHGLALEFRGEAEGNDWMLADVRLEGAARPTEDEILPYLHRDGPFVIFPILGGRSRVIAMLGKTDPARPRPDPTLLDVQAMIDSRTGGGFRATDPVWLSNFRINERKVADYRRGRVALAGDAAHVHSPAGGQGMNTGMQDAIGLAWRLALVVRGAGAVGLLDSYSVERSAVGNMVLRNASRLTAMATLSNPAVQAARNLAIRVALGFPAVRQRMATQMSETAISYPESALSEGPGAGARLAPADYDGPPPGAGSVPVFVLYAADAALGAGLAGKWPRLLEATVRRPPDGHGMLVVRPDGYVGFAGEAAAWEGADAYLRRCAPATGPSAVATSLS